MNVMLARLGNHLFRLSPAIYRPIYSWYKGWSDRAERALLARVVSPGMTVIDVGANVGEYTRFLASLVGPTGKVVAFEPEEKNFAILQRSIADLSQVVAVRSAVAAVSGEIALFVSDELNVDHHTYDDGEGRAVHKIFGVSLDDYIPKAQAVDLIKIDIQGAELAALQGAQRVLTENPGIAVIFEYWPYGLTRAGTEPLKVLEFLAGHGFDIRTIPGGDLFDPATVGSGAGEYTNLYARRPGAGLRKEHAGSD